MTAQRDGAPFISLVATVRNEAGSLPHLLGTLERQTRAPDEMVIVDGGSTDLTVAILKQWSKDRPYPVRVLKRPGANISQGRNQAIAAARGEVIAVTDAGVQLEPQWLDRLVEPFSDPTVVMVAGAFRGQARTLFEAAMSATVLPLPEELDEVRFLPSSRSVAFRKAAWERVGGYPEWARFCEDLLFDMAIIQGGRKVLRRDALVHFAPRQSLPAFWRQYGNYAMGDGQTGLFFKRHLARYLTYLVAVPYFALQAGRHRNLAYLVPLVLGGVAYCRRPWQRLPQLTPGWSWSRRLIAAALVPVIRAWGDVAKMWGYPRGWRDGWRNRALNAEYKLGNVRPTADGGPEEEGQ